MLRTPFRRFAAPVAIVGAIIALILVWAIVREESKTLKDVRAGLAVTLPDGWHGSLLRLGDQRGFFIYTGRDYVGDNCVGMDDSVHIRVLEGKLPGEFGTTPRPNPFGPNDGVTDTQKSNDSLQCDQTLQTMQFSDAGRTFNVTIVMGRNGSQGLREHAYEILDTFSVT